MLCASESAKQEALCALKVIGSASIWLCVCASIPQWNCVLPFPAGTDLSLSNEYQKYTLDTAGRQHYRENSRYCEGRGIRGEGAVYPCAAVCHYCGV